MAPLRYCPDLNARLERLRRLYERRPQDEIFAVFEPPSPALERFAATHEPGYTVRPETEERLAFWDERLRERADVLDDSIPCAYLSELDQGLYGGVAGGSIRYMAHPENGWISSMVPRMLEDWSGFERLAIERDGEAYRYYRRLLDVFTTGAAGRFGISHFILIDGLNFLFELFGATQTYLELIEHPEEVRRAIDFAYQLNVDVQKTFFANVELLEGGTCSNMAGWIPGRIVSESLDPFHMTSLAYFERWGREPAARMLQTFDGGVLHIHGNGRHLIEAAASLPGLKAIYFGDDRGFPSAFSILPEIRRRAGTVPAVAGVGYVDFCRALESHSLTGGVLYKVADVPDADTANRLMDRVREYRA